MDTRFYRNVRGQVGHCGIWCGSCVAGNGVLREVTKQYRKIAREYGFEQWAPRSFNFKEFSAGLTALQNMRICPGCRKGGLSADCPMRPCAARHKVVLCAECPERARCPNAGRLRTMRSGAKKAGLLVVARKNRKRPAIEDWVRANKERFPFSLLFE